MIKSFLQFNESFTEDENFYKHIKFRDKDLQHWLQYDDDDVALNHYSSNLEIENEVNSVLETFENYGEEETPGYIIKNRAVMEYELTALAKTFITFDKKVSRSVLTAYASDYIIPGEKWEQSNKLNDTNDKTGVFES